MRFLDRLERRFGRYAIKGLMTYIVIGNLAVFIFNYLMPSLNIIPKLALIPSYVLKGQVWRLITYIFIPPHPILYLYSLLCIFIILLETA